MTVRQRVAVGLYRAGRRVAKNTPVQQWRITDRIYRRLSHASSADGLVEVTFGGVRLLAAQSDYSMLLALRTGTYEPATAGVFRAAVTAGAAVLDVGANIGLYTLLAAGAAGATGRVVAVEPSAAIRSILEMNLARHDAPTVRVLAVAAGDRAATVRLGRPPGAFGLTTLHGQHLGSAQEYEDVPQRRLEDELRPQRFDVVKVDVEGHEYRALEGLRALLQPDAVLVVEVSRDPDGPRMAELGAASWPAVAVIDDKRRRLAWTTWSEVATQRRVNVVASASPSRLEQVLRASGLRVDSGPA